MDPVTVAKLWMLVKPVKRFKAWRAKRKGEPVLQGKKTYLGIVITGVGLVMGWLGFGSEDASTLSAQLVGALDQILTVGGLLFAAYGRAKAKPAA
jgi:hypothetical protein